MPVFIHLVADVLVDNYVVESARQNKIMMDLSLAHLLKSLKTSMQSIETHIRLVKRNNLPTLVFDNTCENASGKSVKMVQDVPCRLVRPQDAELVRVPDIDRLQTHIVLPPVVTLKTIVERLKNIGSSLLLAANMQGKFNVCVETNTAQVRTFFKDLVNPDLDEDDLGVASQTSYYRRPADDYVECRVDIKQFHKFLQCHSLNPRTIVCCMFSNNCFCKFISYFKYAPVGFYEECGLVLHVYLGESGESAGTGGIGVMTYYLHRMLD